jgi:hypothetical protein
VRATIDRIRRDGSVQKRMGFLEVARLERTDAFVEQACRSTTHGFLHANWGRPLRIGP